MSSNPLVPSGGDFGGAGATARWHEEPLTFADARLIREWDEGKLSAMTRLIVVDAALFAADALGWILLVTSIWRSRQEDAELQGTGIHPAWRAVDVRTKDRPQADVERLVAYLNGRFAYDPQRPSKPIAYAKPHGTGPHVHIQSHPNTIERSFVRSA